MNEKQIQNQILREYATRPSMRLWRQNVGKAVPMAFVKGVRSAIVSGDVGLALKMLNNPTIVSFGVKGQADLSGILDTGHRLEVEVKAPGGRQSQDQEIFENVITKKGGLYVLATSVQDVQKGIDLFYRKGEK